MKSFVVLSVLVALFSYVYAETVCESHKKNSRVSAHGFSMNVTCDGNGKYYPMQCTPDTVTPKWCACFLPDRQVSTMSKNVKRCECPMARGRDEDANKPECERLKCTPDGNFKLLQRSCQGKSYCADPLTGAKTRDLADGQSCPTA